MGTRQLTTRTRFTGTRQPLGSTGRSFTADTIDFVGNLTDVPQVDGTHLVDRIEQITGFSLNGHAVTPAGFGTNYGLYFEFVDHNASGFPPTFLSIDMTLKADPGSHNRLVVSDTSQTGFTNTGPTGQADDIVLAHGSLVPGTGMLFLDNTQSHRSSTALRKWRLSFLISLNSSRVDRI